MSSIRARVFVSAWCGVVSAVAILGLPPTALGQLSAEDIAALQQRAVQEGWTFEVGENDATVRPMNELCGFVVPEGWERLARFQKIEPMRGLPAAFDWRNEVGGPFVPVRNQGGCGSCWAFATVGALECNVLIKDGEIVDLSEQWLVSCNHNGWGCNGGWYAHMYHQATSDHCGGYGAVPESSFPYQAWDMPCDCPYQHTHWIDNWAFIQGTNDGALKQAILDYGPITVTVSVDSAFSAYNGGVFNACQQYGPLNHAVVLVGWDDNQGPDGAWIMRNSWGPNWGENGYMRIAYGCSQIGTNPAFIAYTGPQRIAFEYPDGRPQRILPGQPTVFRMNVVPQDGTPVPGTAELHYVLNGGDVVDVPMTQTAPNEYEATLPAVNCLDRFNWYVSAQQEPSAIRYDPRGAPWTGDRYTTICAVDRVAILEDDFEQAHAWTVDANALSGNWERGAPELSEYWDDDLGAYVVVQPGANHSLNGTQCYVTGAQAGWSPSANDLDGGPSDLVSPAFDLGGRDGTVSYWYWYYGSGTNDYLEVSVSNNDGGTWAPAAVVTATTAGWTRGEWSVGDFITPTARVRVRFRAIDFMPDSVMEVLVDDFRVDEYTCEFVHQPGDLNCDGAVNNFDISAFVLALSATPPDFVEYYTLYADCNQALADVNGDGLVNNFDISPFVALLVGP